MDMTNIVGFVFSIFLITVFLGLSLVIWYEISIRIIHLKELRVIDYGKLQIKKITKLYDIHFHSLKTLDNLLKFDKKLIEKFDVSIKKDKVEIEEE